MGKKLSIWKNLASKLSNRGIRKIKLLNEKNIYLKFEKKRSITKKLINQKMIIIKKIKGVSSFRNKLNKQKKKKGRRRGIGKRKGTKKARNFPKKIWIRKVRLLRLCLKKKKYLDKTLNSFRKKIYKKIKGNFFQSKEKLIEYCKKKKGLENNRY